MRLLFKGPVTYNHARPAHPKMKNNYYGQCVVIRCACIRIRWWFDENAGWTFIVCGAHFRHVKKCERFSTPEERHTSASLTSGTIEHTLWIFCFLWPRVNSVTHTWRTVHAWTNKNNNLSPNSEIRSNLVTNAQRASNANAEWTVFC